MYSSFITQFICKRSNDTLKAVNDMNKSALKERVNLNLDIKGNVKSLRGKVIYCS